MTTKWAHLPNAVHIDRVLASAKADPGQWKKLWVSGRYAAWGAQSELRDSAWEAAREAVRVQVRGAAWDAAWWAARNTPQYAAMDAILALFAYDDCAYMLDSDPGELAILAKFGDPRAVLILPACEILHSLKESVV